MAEKNPSVRELFRTAAQHPINTSLLAGVFVGVAGGVRFIAEHPFSWENDGGNALIFWAIFLGSLELYVEKLQHEKNADSGLTSPVENIPHDEKLLPR